MAMLPSVFNAKDNEKMTGFEVMPVDWYHAMIKKSELKANKKKNGKHLTLQVRITAGKYKGRLVFVLMNLINPNATAVEIAQKELATICDVCGLDEIEDSTELHGIPFGIKLKIKPASANWPAKNQVSEYCTENEILSKMDARDDVDSVTDETGSDDVDSASDSSIEEAEDGVDFDIPF